MHSIFSYGFQGLPLSFWYLRFVLPTQTFIHSHWHLNCNRNTYLDTTLSFDSIPEVQDLPLPPARQDIVARRANAVPHQEVPIMQETQLSVDPGDWTMVPQEVAQVPAAVA